MKKIPVLILLFIVLCMIPVLALAAKCPDHPNAKVDTVITSGYQQHSSVKHMRDADVYCSVCGRYLESKKVFDWHHYNSNDICIDCGYKKPDQDQQTSEAVIIGSELVGRELWVLRDGPICSSPNGSTVTYAQAHQQYYILNYQNVGSDVWLQVSSTSNRNPIGWLSASIVDVSKRDGGGGSELIGRSFRITVSSGRGRTGAGQEYTYIETVHYGEVYTILDVDYASNGVAWYKLHVSGHDCWVSSGLGTIN